MPFRLIIPMVLSGAAGPVAIDVEMAQRKYIREPFVRSAILGMTGATGQLDAIYGDCSMVGWDGHGAKAISQDVFRNARYFLESLPFGMESPQIGAEPDGALTFEWYRTPRKTLSVSINPDGYVYYASLIGASRRHGVDPVQGGVSKDLIALINQVQGIRA